MKENGMDKLVELLNEYGKKVKKSDREWGVDNEGDIFQWVEEPVDGNRYEHYFPTPILISKSYGFIKWLVDNDKIDFSNIKRIILNYKVEDNEAIDYYDLDFATKEETLLMILSIQDNPIEFLISVLK